MMGSKRMGWKVFMDALRSYLEITHGLTCTQEYLFSKDDTPAEGSPSKIKKISFFVLPLCQIEELCRVRKEANKDYASPAFFLVSSDQQIPNIKNLFSESLEIEQISRFFGLPKFGDIKMAVLRAESMPANRDNSDQARNANIINVMEFSRAALGETLLSRNKDWASIEENVRACRGACTKMYYDAFIHFYSLPVDAAAGGGTVVNLSEADRDPPLTIPVKLKGRGQWDVPAVPFMKASEVLFNTLNGRSGDPHRAIGALFQPPIPFPLKDLFDTIDAINGLRNELKNHPIKILLIDNKSDKFRKKDKKVQGPLVELLEKMLGTEGLIDLKMLGGKNWNDAYWKDSLEIFDARAFFKDADQNSKGKSWIDEEFQKYSEQKKNEGRKLEGYRDLVYEKVKDHAFVLLDFFLDGQNHRIAPDFIREIGEMKRKNNERWRTWYFITSSVYDSTVKFSESGHLAEFYESEIVNSGDDPINDKRQIIFTYKLLTFINARLEKFRKYHESILNSNLFCEERQKCKGSTDKAENCLLEQQDMFRKYLGEHEEILNIFPANREKIEFRRTVELLDSTINQFLWLPEADWPMIQRQIDYINRRIRDNKQFFGKKFSCKYIIDEIKKRSDIY